jgi:hypothetical protein
VYRRAALIATAVTVPLVVIIALAIGAVTGGGGESASSTPGVLPALTPSAPPHAAAEAAPCTKVLTRLPVQLGALAQRVVHPHPDTPFVVAWGDPPVVLACGVDRPKDLHPGSSAEFQSGGIDTGPYYDVTSSAEANVWTTVDRGPYIAITVPATYQGADVLPPLSRAIADALPAVCTTNPNTRDLSRLCTRRS